MTRHQKTGRLVGVAEIATRLDVTRGVAGYLTELLDCPPALDVISAGKVWLADDVEPWLRTVRLGERRPNRASPPALRILAFLHERDGPVATAELRAAFPDSADAAVLALLSRLARRGLARRTRLTGRGAGLHSAYEITPDGVAEIYWAGGFYAAGGPDVV